MNKIIKEGGFEYVETKGSGPVVLLLHGLLGALSNFDQLINRFKDEYNVVIPILPIMTLPIAKVGLKGLVQHVNAFVEYKGYNKVNVLGNSLGGHLALLYALEFKDKVQSVTLTGSSGLFENAMGSSFPKRGNYEYIKKKTEDTFYDPKTATKELVDDVFETVSDRNKAFRIILTAKSAIRHNLGDKLNEIEAPTLLIWGKQDQVTPPFVGEKFNELIPNSELHFVDKCGHAPMMEVPEAFNEILADFLSRVTAESMT
jgi:2-hydroxy-6-oxonona-2,4-dienedioate hydrolase